MSTSPQQMIASGEHFDFIINIMLISDEHNKEHD
jgi:hypothetical protein